MTNELIAPDQTKLDYILKGDWATTLENRVTAESLAKYFIDLFSIALQVVDTESMTLCLQKFITGAAFMIQMINAKVKDKTITSDDMTSDIVVKNTQDYLKELCNESIEYVPHLRDKYRRVVLDIDK